MEFLLSFLLFSAPCWATLDNGMLSLEIPYALFTDFACGKKSENTVHTGSLNNLNYNNSTEAIMQHHDPSLKVTGPELNLHVEMLEEEAQPRQIANQSPHEVSTAAIQDEECPEVVDTFYCFECGGGAYNETLDEWLCLGIEEENYRWKDCDCWEMNTRHLPLRSPSSDEDEEAEAEEGDDKEDDEENDEEDDSSAVRQTELS